MQQKLFTVLFLLLFAAAAMSQSVTQVAAGDGNLQAALDAAADGDVIELISDGGVYTEATPLEITKSVTFRGQDGLLAKPIIRGTTSGEAVFKVTASAARLQIENVEIDGTDGAGSTVSKYFVRLDNGDVNGTVVLKVLNSVAHDFTDKAIKAYGNCGIDSLIVDNSILYNGAKEGVTLYSGSSSDPAAIIDYASFTNSTFYNFKREAIKGQTYPNTKVILDRNTFYNDGYDKKSMIYFRDMTDVEVKNSIFVKNQHSDTDKFADFASDASLFHHNDVFDVVNYEVGKATVSDTLHLDPQFADPANGDFTLPADSPLLTFSDVGRGIGDPRWDPTAQLPTVHQVEAGDGTLQAAMDAAEDGDILELADDGGEYTTTTSGSFKVYKTLTIRAAEGLAVKPVVRNSKLDESSPRVFEIYPGGNLILIGLDVDGSASAGGAAHAKNIIRSRDVSTAADSFHFFLKVDDCILHNSKEATAKFHQWTIADSLIFTNTIFDESVKEGILTTEGSSKGGADVKSMWVENCTFTKIGREAIYIDWSDPVVWVNHCTFDSVSYRENKRVIYPKSSTQVTVKNSIFSNQGGTKGVSVELYGDASSISYSDVWAADSAKANSGATIGDGMLYVDPMYADPGNDDYRLATTSPVRGMADDGLAMGDLRWQLDPNKVFLAVVADGQGSVALDPPGGVYDPGTSVTLTATPDAGWAFVGWSDNVSVFPPDNPVATATVNDDMTVTAFFESLAPKYTLEVNTYGLGAVTFDPEPNANGQYDEGTEVTLTAVPGENWAFEKWSGDVTNDDSLSNPVVVKVDSNMSITANFMALIPRFALDLTVQGEGSVTVDPQPFLGKYDTLTVVKLTATPVPGWAFIGWSGDLSGDNSPDSLVMDADKAVAAAFEEIVFETRSMEIDTTWDLRDAVEFANNNSYIDSLILVASGGLYTSTSTSDVAVMQPLTIVAKPGLEKKPVLTNSDVEKGNDDILRVFDDFTIVGVVLDGGNEASHGMKYGIRLRHYTKDSVRTGANITVKDCDFVNFFEDKDLNKDGHCFKIDVGVAAGVVKFEDCTFTNTGYEAIRISDTEKWATDRALDSLVVRNCTFTNIDAEAVRYYSDLDPSTPDAPVLLEHITINGSATRAFFLKNSGGAIARDIIIANSRKSGHGRDDDLMDVQGNTGLPSFVSDIDTFKVAAVPIKSSDGQVDSLTVWGIDPMFEDAANLNYTLAPESHLYGLGHDGEALGDLNWATNEPTHVALSVMIEGEGNVFVDPDPVGLTYDPNQHVTLTAVADSGSRFLSWSGDLTGSDNPATLKLDASKNVVATFEKIPAGVEADIPDEYSLSQNYPNPFNPSTTIKFALKAPGHTTVKVFDMLGREVQTLVDKEMVAGRYEIQFHNLTVSSGTYFYTITSGEFTSTKKMILIK